MSLSYKDFFPLVLKSGFLYSEREDLRATVARADEWIKSANVHVLNLETVLIPNVNSPEEASQARVGTSGETGSYWNQVVRVWYDKPDRLGQND